MSKLIKKSSRITNLISAVESANTESGKANKPVASFYNNLLLNNKHVFRGWYTDIETDRNLIHIFQEYKQLTLTTHFPFY